MDKKHLQIVEFYELGQLKNGVFEAPVLYSRTTNNQIRTWQIFVALTRSDGRVNIVPDHIMEKKEEPGAWAELWTFSEVMDTKNPTKPSDKTIIKEGKNAGRKNYTTPLTQALFQARSEYNKKIRRGATTQKLKHVDPDKIYTFQELASSKVRGEYPWRVFPQAVHNYKKHSGKITEPFAVQRKRDGVRFVTVVSDLIEINRETDSDGVFKHMDGYSRGRKTYEIQNHILEELLPALKKYPELFIDGELYKHGLSLQEISGQSRRETELEDNVDLDYHVFDCFYVDRPMPWTERQQLLDEVFRHIKQKNVKRTKSYTIQKSDLNRKYKKFLEEKYEGIVIYNLDASYKVGIHREIRSYDAQKLKPRPDAEWPCVDFTQGKRGKEIGAIIYICEATTPGGKKKLFSVTPNLPQEERYKLFKEMSKKIDSTTEFEANWKGKPYKIAYSILSQDNVPQQPKGLGFRTEGT